MGEDIVVLDDFLPRRTYDALAQLIAAEPLVYGSRSNFKTDPHGHWSRDFVAAGPHNLADVGDLLGADEIVTPIDAAWRFLRDARLPDSVLVRCYVNGYTYGTDGYFHADSRRADEHTAIVYMNEHWEPDWAGETVFLDAGGDIVTAVLPRRNRAVVFPAGVQHAGRSVSRKCMVLRKTLIFKVRQRRSPDFEDLSAFLRTAGAVARGHQTGSLHDHLVRTFSMLEERGVDRSVCFGGGLHSMYGTNKYPHGVLPRDDNADVVRRFGKRAEELAFLFSVLERPGTLESPEDVNDEVAVVKLADGETLELSRSTFDDLRQIECANLSDQGSLARHRVLSGLWNGS